MVKVGPNLLDTSKQFNLQILYCSKRQLKQVKRAVLRWLALQRWLNLHLLEAVTSRTHLLTLTATLLQTHPELRQLKLNKQSLTLRMPLVGPSRVTWFLVSPIVDIREDKKCYLAMVKESLKTWVQWLPWPTNVKEVILQSLLVRLLLSPIDLAVVTSSIEEDPVTTFTLKPIKTLPQKQGFITLTWIITALS